MPATDFRAPSADLQGGGVSAGDETAGGRGTGYAYFAALTAVAVAWVVMHAVRPVPRFPLDDPYITLHSAQVLHWGYDPNYPGVPALYGATSAPFLGLVYLLLFALPPLHALDTACWLGVVAYTMGLVFLARTMRLGKLEGAGVITLGLFSSFVPVHLLNGLETSWALAGVIWTLALASASQRRTWMAALAGGFTAAIRPDLGPFAAMVVVAMTFETAPRPRTVRNVAVTFGRLTGIALIPMLPFMLWYLEQTGSLLPLTAAAKEYYFATGQMRSLQKIRVLSPLVGIFALSCGPLLPLAICSYRSALSKAAMAFAVLTVVVAYKLFPDAFAWNYYRYTVILIPFLVWGVADFASKRGGVGRKAIAGCAVWSLLLVLPAASHTYVELTGRFDDELHALVTWCEQNLPPDARLLVQDAGYVAYGSHFRIVDYVGLKTPEAIELNKEYVWPTLGARRAEVVATLSRKTDAHYLIILSQIQPTTVLPQQLREIGWRVEPLRTEGLYRVYRLQPPPSEGR